MGTALAIAILATWLGGYIAYGNWLTNGIKPRSFETSLSAEQLRTIFTNKVARTGWKIVDDGNPIVAQSNLATGIRQQIGLELHTNAATGKITARIAAHRWVSKRFGYPTKAHTMRIRINSFVEAARAAEPSILVSIGELRPR